MTVRLDQRRRNAEQRLEQMRHAQGAALLDGKEIDLAAMADIEHQLAVIDAAEGEAARRQREAEEAAYQRHRAALRKELAETNEKRLAALSGAENTARSLAMHLKSYLDLTEEVFRQGRALDHVFSNCQFHDARDRLSRRLTHALKNEGDIKRRFGAIELPEAWQQFAGPWREAEQKLSDPEISKALKEA